jgi:hypothetical protein
MFTIEADHAVGAGSAEELVRRWAIIRLFTNLRRLY